MSIRRSSGRHNRIHGCQTCGGRGFTHFKKEGGYDDCVECHGMGLVILKSAVQPESTYQKAVRRVASILTVGGQLKAL
jgi:hypothetical protein